MSYEYYLHACEDQGEQEVPTQRIVEIFEPDGHAPITLLPETEAHLMEGMVESLGTPVVASSWEEFYQLWENNRN